MADLAAVRARCVGCLVKPEEVREPLTALSQLVVDAVHTNDSETAADAMQVLFDMSCSGSGTQLLVEEAADPTNGAAALVLGFAGSALNILTPQVAFYRQRFGWKVVATVASGLCDDPLAAAHFDRQCDQVVAALAGVKKILVHIMSNNGQGMWATLLHRKGSALRSRVAAVVYDCACARSAEPHEMDGSIVVSEMIAHVVKSTVLMPLIQHEIEVNASDGGKLRTRDGESLRRPVEAAARSLGKRLVSSQCRDAYFWANRVRLDGLSCHSYDAKHCPHVPVLCLTSPEDTVIVPEAVDDWAAFLREHSGGRREVRVERAPSGSHCMLLQRHADFYTQTISSLVEMAGVSDRHAPVKAAYQPSDGTEDGPLASVLLGASAAHLLPLFGTLGLDGCCELYAQGRPKLLARLKELGVISLSERQAVANAVGKWLKENHQGK